MLIQLVIPAFVSSSFPDDFDNEMLDKGAGNTTAGSSQAPKYGQKSASPGAAEVRKGYSIQRRRFAAIVPDY